MSELNHERDVGIVSGESPNSRMIRLDANTDQIMALIVADQYFRTNHISSINYTPIPELGREVYIANQPKNT